ncbi:hypothetical protein SDRG_05265 [Saprolegnia diclina VS20]|uniref:Uncharacterized protein n=1 Tax=Saprolegnia diclina (strain VS20) TaxID=1156394 RepID=T0QQN0_SAPDV|nr:hypothetical protein SDRG_05265 [Saprolegnia diclina VS20]EQC37036.1 hypothetical protein SDRG_05265 [Saprolegnia diclina VS20]|eukprot:XP_008609198.1 hypothetical protein SDRG_05265 [Saprolegnia diclina VS20]
MAAARVLGSRDLLPLVSAYQRGTPQEILELRELLDAIDLAGLHALLLAADDTYPATCFAAFAAFHKRVLPASLLRVAFTKSRPAAVYYALVHGNLAVVRGMRTSSRAAISNSQWIIAATFGHFHVVEYLHRHDWANYDPRAMKAAAMRGNLAMVVYLEDLGYWSPHVLRWACTAGQLHVAEFANDRETTRSLGAGTINDVVRSGNFPVLRFLHENGYDGFSDEAVDIAAARGDLATIRFLNDKRRLRGTRNAMLGAVDHNHIEVVRYLDKHCRANDIAGSLRRAAACGHLELVTYFCSHYEGETLLVGALEAARRSLRVVASRTLRERLEAVVAYLQRLRPTPPADDAACTIQ